MGDNIWLPDRDASRTPMQWTPDRNAGFSTAEAGKLFLPVVNSLVYNHSAVNVESQLAQSSSLLHWVRKLIHLRKTHPTFGLGSIRVLPTDNDSVLAFLRIHPPTFEQILCIYSFSHSPLATTVTVDAVEGTQVRDLFAGARFPDVDKDGGIQITLGPQGFFWLSLTMQNESLDSQ